MIWFRGRKNCQRISENRRIKRSRESGFSLTRYLLWCVYRVMSFSIDYIPSNLSRLSSCFQNHMNTLAAETASAWYLILNRKRPPKRAVASYFNMTQFSSHLPRNPDDGNITGLRWRGCHNSAASFYSCAAGFPPSL